MQAFVLTFLLLIAAVSGMSTVAYTEDLGLVKALSMIKRGDRAKAYRLMERSFDRNTDLIDKARLALMLALAEKREIKRPRHLYASFALRNYRNLDSTNVRRLTRIIGDGKLQDGDLDGARQSFQFILSSPLSEKEEKEYATIKLGWIYMNQNGPQRAFRLWQNWLEHDRGGKLRQVILEDAGSAWAEAVLQNRSTSLRLRLADSTEELAFFTGILDGLEDVKGAVKLEVLLKAMSAKTYFSAFLNHLFVKRRQALLNQPCKHTEWIERANPAILKPNVANTILTHCQKHIRKLTDIKNRKNIAEIYSRYSLTGMARRPKARSLFAARDYRPACIEFSNAIIDTVRAGDSLGKVPSVLREAVQACKKADKLLSVADLKVVREMVEVTLSSRKLQAHWKSRMQELNKPMVELLKIKGMETVALNQLVKAKALWKGTSLPLAFLRAFSGNEGAQRQILQAWHLVKSVHALPEATARQRKEKQALSGLIAKWRIQR